MGGPDLGHKIGAEALNNLVKRAGHGRQRGQMLDQRIVRAASRHSTGWPSRITGREDRLPSLSVSVGLVELYWEGMREVV